MASLSRSVEGLMGDDMYRKLGDVPNTETTWKYLRDLIGQQVFGTEFVTVPFLDCSKYYNQLSVFTKKSSLLSMLGFKPPVYKVVGNLDHLINRDISTWVPQFDFSPWDVADGLNMYREYKLRVASNRAGPEKSIELMVIESHVRSAVSPVPGSLTIKRDLSQDLARERTLYVITDVVLASFVKLQVRIGELERVLIHDTDTPIGFRYRKFRLLLDGTFIAEAPTKLKFTDREALWNRPSPNQPILSVPRWDSMRRRPLSRRKTRHNLTIPTPEHSVRNRRMWAADGNRRVRVRRHDIGGALVNAAEIMDLGNEFMDQDDDRMNPFNQRAPQNQNNQQMNSV